jgi:myo-inositol 2-dehydrogenase/D-chiro-inositol 1-dehydrogenase
MLLTFASGMSLAFAASAHATWLFPFERIEVFGDHRIAVTEELDRITFVDGLGEPAHTLDFTRLPLDERWGYTAEDRLFVDAACGTGPPPVAAGDALATAELVDRCFRAAGSAAESA